MDLTSVLDVDYQSHAAALRFQSRVMYYKTKELLDSRNSSFPFGSFDTMVLDQRFIELWTPLLDKLPISQLGAALRGHCEALVPFWLSSELANNR